MPRRPRGTLPGPGPDLPAERTRDTRGWRVASGEAQEGRGPRGTAGWAAGSRGLCEREKLPAAQPWGRRSRQRPKPASWVTAEVEVFAGFPRGNRLCGLTGNVERLEASRVGVVDAGHLSVGCPDTCLGHPRVSGCSLDACSVTLRGGDAVEVSAEQKKREQFLTWGCRGLSAGQ